MTVDIGLKTYFNRGCDYTTYLTEMERKIRFLDPDQLKGKERERYEAMVINHHRSLRIGRTYKLPGRSKQVLASIGSPQYWLCLTEHWCGDSAQSLPIIAKMAEQSPNIHLRLLYRDEHPELMNRYLTGGKRSIPKLIAFTPEGVELFQWGPRPLEAARLWQAEMKAKRDKTRALQTLHLWYGRNRGKAIELEFMNLLHQFGADE